MTWILKENGQPDYLAMTAEAQRMPPTLSIAEQKLELLALTARERARVYALVRTGGLAALQAEHDAADSSYRRQQETDGKLRTAAESKRLSDAIAARQDELNSVPSEITERSAEAKQKYDDAVRALAERTAAPATEKDMQDAADISLLHSQQRARYTAAAAESRKPDVDIGKF